MRTIARMSENTNQSFSQHKDASSNYEAKILPGTSPTQQGNNQFSELHVNGRGKTCGAENNFSGESTSNNLLSNIESIFPHISELVALPPTFETLISNQGKSDSRKPTIKTNDPPVQDSSQSGPNHLQQNGVSTTSDISLMPNQPERLYSWPQSYFPPSAPQIQGSSKLDSQYNLALSSIAWDNQQNKTNPRDRNANKPIYENSILHTPLNMQKQVTNASSDESRFKKGANNASRHVEMPFDAPSVMPTSKDICQPYMPLNNLTARFTDLKQGTSNAFSSKSHNKTVRYSGKKPKISNKMILSYILSLAYQCSVFLIPLDAFESTMTSYIEIYSELILHYSDYFKRIVSVMMTELAKYYSPELFPWQVDPPQDLIAWGDFKVPRDRFGRQQETASLSTQCATNENMIWTCFFQAAVTGLCKKMQNQMDGTETGPPRLPNTAHSNNHSVLPHQYIGPYSRFPPPMENNITERSSGYFSGPLHASDDFMHKIRDSHLVNLSKTANNDSESLHSVCQLGTVSMGCLPMLPPYLRNEKQNVHSDSFSMNPQVAYSSSFEHPGPVNATNRWEYSTTAASQNKKCMEEQNKENNPSGAAGGSNQKHMPLVNFVDEARVSASQEGKEKTHLDPKNPPKEQCRCEDVAAFNKMFTQPSGDVVDVQLSPLGTRRVSYNHQTGYKILYERNSKGYIDVFIKQPSGYTDIISTEPSGKINIFFKRKFEEMRDFCLRHPSSLNFQHRNLLDNRAGKVGFSNRAKKS